MPTMISDFRVQRWRAAAAVICAVFLLQCGCSWLGGLVTAEIVVKSSRQSLREQILGTYDEVGEEVYLLAGVRSVDPLTGKTRPAPPTTESERRALQARRSMEFNRDDLLLFKRLGFVGEGRDGLLVFFDDQKERLASGNAWLAGLVADLTAEENRDRLVIMKRIVETTPELRGEGGLQMVQQVMAEKYRSEAEPGMRVQLPDGAWVTKEGGGG
jgi:hypothetical protein